MDLALCYYLQVNLTDMGTMPLQVIAIYNIQIINQVIVPAPLHSGVM